MEPTGRDFIPLWALAKLLTKRERLQFYALTFRNEVGRCKSIRHNQYENTRYFLFPFFLQFNMKHLIGLMVTDSTSELRGFSLIASGIESVNFQESAQIPIETQI